jgi:hypothetical protein
MSVPRQLELYAKAGDAGFRKAQRLRPLEMNPVTVAALCMRLPSELGDATQTEVLHHSGVGASLPVVIIYEAANPARPDTINSWYTQNSFVLNRPAARVLTSPRSSTTAPGAADCSKSNTPEKDPRRPN